MTKGTSKTVSTSSANHQIMLARCARSAADYLG
jgi:hypothetical protein